MNSNFDTSWQDVSLGDVCRVTPGYAFKSKDWQSEGIPVIKIRNIQSDRTVNIDNVDCVPQHVFTTKLSKFVLRDGDILVAMTGATAGKVGRLRTRDRMLLNQRVAKIEPLSADRDFMWCLLSSDEYQERFFRLADGAAQPNMSGSQIERVQIRLPPLETQRQIAGILSAYDDLIENNTRRIRILEEMAQSLYREWFVHFRYPGHEHVPLVESSAGLIPEGWEVVPLAEMYDTSSGGTPSRKIPEYYAGSIPWVKTRELRDDFVFETEEHITEAGLAKSSAKLFPSGTVVMAMYGATIGKLGILALSACTNQACCAVLPRGDTFGREFGYFMLRESREKLISLGAGAAQQNISQKVIREFPVLKPAVSIAAHYAELAGPMLDQVAVLQQQRRNLILSRNHLLPELVSGKLAVDVAASERDPLLAGIV